MRENSDLNEFEPLRLSTISLEQGKVLVSRIENCLKGNTNADLFVLLDFGAAPLEVIMRELTPGMNLNIQHLKIDRDSVQRLGSFSARELQVKIGKPNMEFLRGIIEGKKHVVLVDDIEYEGKTLNLAETIVKFINSECEIVRFPIIKSSQNVLPGSDAWPFAVFDDVGLVKGFRMPWEDDQSRFVGRRIEGKIDMWTSPVDNLDPLSVSLKNDLQKVSEYFKYN